MKRQKAQKSEPNPLQIDERLCFALYSASLAMTQVYKPMLTELRLTYPQFLVMMVLWERDAIGVKDIADRLRQDSAAVTPMLKRLQSEGYVERGRDLSDERSLRVMLTPAGRALRERAVGVSDAFASVCDLSHAQTDLLRGALTALETRLRRAAATS